MIARLPLLLFTVLGCSGGSSTGSKPPPSGAAPPVFAPPASIGACAAERLGVLEVSLDLGVPYKPFQWLPLEYALERHSYATDRLIVLLVPEVDFQEKVVSLLVLRFDVAARTLLPNARYELGNRPRLGPRYTEFASAAVGQDHVMTWTDFVTRARQGVVFSSANGAFRAASPAEVASLPPYSGLARDAATPPNPEPTTAVSIKSEIMNRRATFSRAGTELGTVHFPTLQGTYVAAFQSTRSAFFWHNGEHAEQARLPPEQQRQSYLVHLETGASCRIERELAYPASAVFRRPSFVAFVNALRNEPRQSDCPPGAPCAAPEQSHFVGASLVIFTDRG